MVAWLPCRVARGQFRDEWAVEVRDGSGAQAVALVPGEDVRPAREPQPGETVLGWVRVAIVDDDGVWAVEVRDGSGAQAVALVHGGGGDVRPAREPQPGETVLGWVRVAIVDDDGVWAIVDLPQASIALGRRIRVPSGWVSA